jgi:hypothetical protein
MSIIDSGRQVWICYGGIATQIRFVTGSGEAAVASTAVDVVWVDESGMLDNSIMDVALPMFWEKDSDLICSGTPELGLEHWFSLLILRGLDEKHPFWKPDIVEKDGTVTTIIGSSYEAFDLNVRKKAKLEARHKGSAWEAQWVLGDFRLPDLFIYDEWKRSIHVVEYDHETWVLNGQRLPRPNTIAGIIDWAYSPRRPGGCVVFHRWAKNPLDSSDSRPLIIACEDRQKRQPYTADGWYADFIDLRDRYGFNLWYADPSMKEMLTNARKFGIGAVKAAEKADKAGRINLTKSLLHHNEREGIYPALYVSDKCKNLPRQFERYKYVVNSRGEATDKPTDSDDHCLDCVAFAMGTWVKGGYFMGELDL